MKAIKLALIAATLLLGAACSHKTDATSDSDSVAALAQTAPDPETATMTITDSLPMVVDFSASWCPPCRKLKPVYAKLTKEYQGRVTMIGVDVDENTQMAEQFGVQSIPTLIFFTSDGKQIDRTVGYITEDDLRSRLDALLQKESAN